MTSPTVDPGGTLVCTRCGGVLERCAFCERVPCPEAICARCLRLALGESIAHPHQHGG